jgi:hypothetical protein
MLEFVARTPSSPVPFRPRVPLTAVAMSLTGRTAASSAVPAPLPASAMIGARLPFAWLAVLPLRACRGLVRHSLSVSARRMGVMRGLWSIRAGSRRLRFVFRRHGGAQLRNDPS